MEISRLVLSKQKLFSSLMHWFTLHSLQPATNPQSCSQRLNMHSRSIFSSL